MASVVPFVVIPPDIASRDWLGDTGYGPDDDGSGDE